MSQLTPKIDELLLKIVKRDLINFLHKGPDSEYSILGFVGHGISFCHHSTLLCSSHRYIYINDESGCVHKCYSWTMKYEFWIIFMSWNTIFLFIFFQPFKNVKIFLNLPASQKQAGRWGRFAVRAVSSLATTVIKD